MKGHRKADLERIRVCTPLGVETNSSYPLCFLQLVMTFSVFVGSVDLGGSLARVPYIPLGCSTDAHHSNVQ